MSAVAMAAGVLAVALGGWLAALAMRAAAAPGWLRAAHGLAGGATLTLLTAGLAAAGWRASAFQWDALALLGAGFALGLLLLFAWARLGAQRGMVILLHGFAGMAGVALLASWAL